ncbi:hypothetical protein IVB41_34090 [Bradyrhizobium sp. 44]|uniref:hypothetical protein n=1 Tax=Bradyrhizobium sp. 44 TaxID=2782675 RepID=UPI001FFB0F71|nr:hypothetical protein [Bradyrhizobium sp. 44]MCK1288942.1 hypothetical protein [Bradyrhizobium sp. 44]
MARVGLVFAPPINNSHEECPMSSERDDRSSGRQKLEATDYDFVEKHFEANGLGWGAGDLVMFRGALGVLGEILAHSLAYVGQDTGRRAVHRILLMQPPGVDEKDAVVGVIEDVIARGRGEKVSAEESEILSRMVSVVNIPNFTTENLVAMLAAAEPRSVAVIRHAESYRTSDSSVGAPAERLGLPEDTWAPHLGALCARAIETVRDREVYAVIDADQEWPIRKAHQDLLNGIEGLGVLSGSVGGSASEVLASRLEGWTTALQTGAIGQIQRDIDALPSRFDAMKPLLHLQILRKAGLDGIARQAIAAMPADFASRRPADAVVVAEIALELGDAQAAGGILSGIDLDSIPPELLETSLTISDGLGLTETADRAERLLEARSPASPGLARYRIRRALTALDYRAAADIASKRAIQDGDEEAALYELLAGRLGGDAPDHAGALRAIGDFAPKLRRRAIGLIAQNALRRGSPVAALGSLASVAADDMDEWLARLTLRAVRESIVSGSSEEGASGAMLKGALSNVVAVVAGRPSKGRLRNELARTVSVETMGLRGLALLMSIALEGAERPQKPEPVPDYASWPKAASYEAVFDFLAPTLQWLAKAGPAMIGHIVLPESLVPSSADALVMGLLRVLEGHSIAPDRIDLYKQILVCAVALAPHASIKDTDLSMIRMAAVRMALSNRHQEARDYAETALLLAGDTPRRARIAWLCHGDVYARNNNLHEALIAACCGYMANGSATPDQIWSESMLLFRIARDLGMTDNALAFLDAAKKALSGFGALGRYGVQIDTSALQLRMLHFHGEDDVDRDGLPGLLEDVVENARAVLAGDHQVGPVAVVLGQIVREARLAGLDVAQEALDVLAELAGRADDSQKPLLDAALKARPSRADVATLLGTLGAAQHAEDFAFDLRQIVVIAHRLLASEEALADPAVAAFAVELLSDLAVVPPGAARPVLPQQVEGPLAQATVLSAGASLPVVFLGLDSEGFLVRTTVAPDGAAAAVREDKSVFDRGRFRKWAEEFPFRYGVDETTFNLFHLSTEGLGVSDLPERAVIVAGAALQRIPPNVLRVGEGLAGEDRRLFMVPSMAWLSAARAMPPRSGKSAAWISTEATPTAA